MTRASCDRQWQVEAVRDGRIAGPEVARVLRHTQQCPQCSREAAELDALGAELRSLPDPTHLALNRHRLRQRLFADLNGALLRGRSEGRSPYVVVALAALLITALLVGVHVLRSPGPEPSRQARLVEVAAKPGARWREERRLNLHRVELLEGEATFRVHRERSVESVIFVLPDGEVLDLGTVFSISVVDHETSRVAVETGRVLVRLRGRPELQLKAGESWTREPAPPRDADLNIRRAEPDRDHETNLEHRSLAAPLSTPRPRSVTPHRAPVQQRPASANSGPEPEAEAATKKAVPSSRDEDAAYLEIVKLLGEGQGERARSAAKQYLLRFPSGFRREEVLNVVTRGR